MKIYLCEIPQDNGLSRHQREAVAVSRLVCEAFGEGAVKENLPSGIPTIKIKGEEVRVPLSISHCASMAALVVGEDGKSIGVDVEVYRNQLRRVVHKFLSAEEAAFYKSDADLLAAWTLKEAAYKAALTPGLALTDIHLPLSADSNEISISGRTFRIERCGYVADSNVWLSVVALASF